MDTPYLSQSSLSAIRPTRRTFLGHAGAGVALITLGPAVAGCAGTGSGTPPKPGAPVEIEYWSTLAETHPEGKGRIEALKIAERDNADYLKIRFEQGGGTSAEKIIAAVTAGTPPNLIVFRPNNGAQLFDLGGAIHLDDELKALPAWQKLRPAILDSYLDGAVWRSKLVCLPLYIVNQAMMYAPDHLERAGVRPPAPTWTWRDFEDIAKRAARPPDVWGLDIAWRSSSWQLWAGSNGARFFNKERTKVSVTQPESVAAMEFLANLTHGLRLVPPESLGELLVRGQTVFEPQGPYRMPVLREAGARFEPILMPRGPHKPTAYNWGSMYSSIVFKTGDAAKQRAAVRAAVGALADEAQVAMCRVHLGLPISKTAVASSGYQQLLAQDRQMKIFVDMAPHCEVLPAIPSWDDMARLRDQMTAKIYRREDSISNALREAEQQAQRLLDEDLARASRR